jgi:restriction endonuclease S subunit
MMQLTEQQKKEGWRIVKFGEIAKCVSKRVLPGDTDLEVYVGLEHLDPDNLRITRRGVPSDVTGQKLRVRPGQIIFGKRRAYQRKVAVADFDGICSAHAMVLEAMPKAVLPEFLPFFMQSDMFMERAVSISEGSLSPTIKWKTLANQEFPLPPRKRQEEMLEVFSSVDKVIDSCNNSILSFDGLITASELKLLTKFTYYSEDRKDIEIKLSDIGAFKNGLNKDKKSYGQGKPFVNLNDIFSNDIIDFTPRDLVTATKKETLDYSLNEGDILFVRSSVKPSGVGLTALVNKKINDLTYCGFIIRFRPFAETAVSSEFLNILFRSTPFRHRISAFVTVSANSNVNQKALSNIKIILPDKNHEADLISYFEKMRTEKKHLQNNLNHTIKLKKRLLKEIFGGPA